MSEIPTVTDLLTAQAGRTAAGLRCGADVWSWDEVVAESAARGEAMRSLLAEQDTSGPPHIGVLADNGPEFAFLLGGAALSGCVLVGLNPTRRGRALARDVRTADCRAVLSQPSYRELLGLSDIPVLDLDGPEWTQRVADSAAAAASPAPATPDDLVMLIFTSGTSGEPKAVRCTHGKIAFPGRMLAERFALSTTDTVYVSMPMFHSNAIMAGWAVGLAAGATVALRDRFSAGGFLPDVRRFGATYANYVGTPLSYVLATPERPDDADNPLRVVYGNEGATGDLTAFARRFDCHVVDAFGSTEGGVGFSRTPDTPPGSLGRPADGVRVLHPDTGRVCPPAEFHADGRLGNPEEAVGELVNTAGAGWFAGYYNAPAADAERVRGGRYHTGDLAYADSDGYVYHVGRTSDWLRVDGENLAAAPIERILTRHPGVAEAAVYGVPGHVGDLVMAAVVPPAGTALEAGEFAAFLSRQDDLGPKQRPRYVRITSSLPTTATFKVRKRDLAAEGIDCADPVWTDEGGVYRVVTPEGC